MQLNALNALNAQSATRARCAGSTAAGRPCRNHTGPGRPLCRWHEAARWTPVECVGGPMDGCRYSLREARGWRVLYALRGAASGRLNVYRPSDYDCHVRAGGHPDIIGRYRLQYAGLSPFWAWEPPA